MTLLNPSQMEHIKRLQPHFKFKERIINFNLMKSQPGMTDSIEADDILQKTLLDTNTEGR